MEVAKMKSQPFINSILINTLEAELRFAAMRSEKVIQRIPMIKKDNADFNAAEFSDDHFAFLNFKDYLAQVLLNLMDDSSNYYCGVT